MTRAIAIVIGVVAVVGFATPRAAGQEENPFAAGTWNLSLNASYITHIRFSQAHLYNANFSIGRYLFDNHSLNLELSGIYAEQAGDDDAIVGGIGLLGRSHLLRFDRWSIFMDGGGEATYADHQFPTHPFDGTHFNVIGKVGFGATYELRERMYLIGGARYFHMSNAQIHGRDQNPTYDGIQFWGGMMWTW